MIRDEDRFLREAFEALRSASSPPFAEVLEGARRARRARRRRVAIAAGLAILAFALALRLLQPHGPSADLTVQPPGARGLPEPAHRACERLVLATLLPMTPIAPPVWQIAPGDAALAPPLPTWSHARLVMPEAE